MNILAAIVFSLQSLVPVERCTLFDCLMLQKMSDPILSSRARGFAVNSLVGDGSHDQIPAPLSFDPSHGEFNFACLV